MRNRRRNPLVRLAIDRPVTTVMAFLAVLVLGAIAYQRIPVQQLPGGFTPPWMSVVVPYQGGTPREVEQQITMPIEEALRTVEGVDKIGSQSGRTGSFTFIRFTGSTDMDVAYAQVTDRIERVRARLPEDVDAINVRKFNLEDMAVLYLAVYPREGSRDPERFLVQNSHLIESLVKRLERVPGVARVDAAGLFGDRVEIGLDQDLVVANRVDLYQVIQSLRRENFNLSSGRITVDGAHYYLRSMARLEDPGRLASLPVRDGLELGDLGEVRHVYSAPQDLSRINGRVSVILEVFLEGDANTVDTCRAVRDSLDADLETDPRLSSFAYTVLHDQGESIEASIDGLRDSALWGALLAVLILYFFLRRLGMTVVITTAIPLSLVVALAVLYFEGESLNLLSLMGLTVGVGMLVDNSVVVVENIDRRRVEGGRTAREAASLGASEIALAVLISTSTSMVVFLPLVLMGDDQMFRFFMTKLGMPVCYALLASLFVALVFIPLAASRSLPAGVVRLGRLGPFALAGRVLGVLDRGIETAIAFLGRIYQWVLRLCLARPFDAVLWLLVPAMASTFWVYGRVDQTDRGQEMSRDFSITIHFPDGFTLDEADQATAIIEERLLERAEDLEIVDLFTTVNERRSRLRATLTPREEARRDRREIVEEVERLLPRLPGVDARMGQQWRRSAGSESSVNLVLEGRDSDRLAEIAGEVTMRLEGLPGLSGIESDMESGFDEIRIEIDRKAATRYRLEPRSIIGTVQYALRGSQLPDLFAGDREIPLIVRMKVDADFDVERLRNLSIWASDGTQVPLGAIATVTPAKGFGNIRHDDGRTVLTLSAEGEGDLRTLSTGIEARLAGLSLPTGYSWKKGGRFDDWERNQSSFLFAVVLAVVFVFLLMGVLFESFLLPLAVLFSIPFAFTGVYWILYLTDTPLGIMSFIGIIILVGVVINNGVVLVDLINRLRADGLDRAEAILVGCRDRLRPILMTASTTIVGLLPMAMGSSSVADVPYYPLGRALIGGLAASTLFTLFLVPVAYRIFDDLSVGTRSRLASLLALGRNRRTPGPV